MFDANGFPVFDANGNPVLTKAGTCPSGFCVSDCNNDARVTVDEILSLVNVALGNTDVSTCLFGDLNHDGQITVDEILTAVNTALNGCPPPPATPTPGQPRFVDNGDGTITDVQTGLMWEKKSDDSGIHDKDDTYTWSTCSDPSCSPDGTAFSVFLKALNDSNLAGYHDWRLPTFGELNSIFDSDAWAYGSGAPYVPPVFNTNCGANSDGNVGCTVDGAVSTPACSCTATTYWSLSTEEVYLANGPVTFPLAFDFYHGTGVFLSLSNKNATSSVRAVRGVPPGTGIPGL